ncbi:YmL15 [Boothiomyces sp. JEL0838]|nr:YmL15 [Boothiomyces sp. JEL0838]
MLSLLRLAFRPIAKPILKPIFKPIIQTRFKTILTLNNVTLPKNAQKKRKVVGRGGKGRTAGRGRKGYKHRSSKARPYRAFTGGQSSIVEQTPKIGVQNRGMLKHIRQNLRPLALDTLQHWINVGRIDASKKITMKTLVESKVCGKIKDGVVLLGRGAEFFTAKVDIECNKATENAIQAIEKNGGKVTTVYFDKNRIHSLMNAGKYHSVPEMILPPRRLIAAYADEGRRGYLAPIAKNEEKHRILAKIIKDTGIKKLQ